MKKIVRILLGVLAITIFYSCNSDDNNDGGDHFDGSYESIKKIIGEEVLDNMVDLGMVIHTGINPPFIEGAYELTTVLSASNTPMDHFLIGSEAAFPPQTFEFYNQDIENSPYYILH